ncbi:MAG: hypothetical protein KF819_36675 [Labilithrix sp.]|nr:hypothetical protein [Labilithrix sp.]
MSTVPFVPRPASWMSAVFLYLFMGLLGGFVASVLPRLIEIGEESPRLAALGYLALWTSPIPLVAILHHGVHAFLDHADRDTTVARGLLPGVSSLWAGVYAWLVIFFATTFMIFVWMIVSPPEDSSVMGLARAFTWPFGEGVRAGVHTLGWVVVAALLYDLDRAVKARAARE